MFRCWGEGEGEVSAGVGFFCVLTWNILIIIIIFVIIVAIISIKLAGKQIYNYIKPKYVSFLILQLH